ncbi:carbohydrate sulfotransferase 10-like isoform X2 [Amphiura filiformis]|uniref:carbohydrate sulfotransferase 10-like isoform X2 n=1 Tax=Amphiura filiformis TaxID=82378 RepID=UPI003B22296E
MVTSTCFNSAGNTTSLVAYSILLIVIGLLFLCYDPDSTRITKYFISPTEKSTRYKPISRMNTQRQGQQQFCDEECQWLQLQSHRRETLHEACTAYNESSPNNLRQWLMDHLNVLLFLWVSDKHKALYCNVPKVASTNWKKVFYILNKGVVPYNQSFISNVISNLHVHTNTTYADWQLMRMSPKDVIHRLKTYTKFIIVRDPFTRTLSAYREKFENEHNQNRRIWKTWIYKMYLYVTRQNSLFELPYGSQFTWPEFLQFVSNPNAKFTVNGAQHWMPISELCFPCQIKYDIIGKLETLDNDAKFILKKLGVPELESVVSSSSGHATNSSDADTQHTYLDELSVDDVNGFERKYEKDFKLFGYSMFSYVQN